MPSNDASDAALLAVLTGTAVTTEHLDAVRTGQDAVLRLADEVRVGATSALPDAPQQWCSEAGTAYAEVLVGTREALAAAAAILEEAGTALMPCVWELHARLDELNAALASRPAS